MQPKLTARHLPPLLLRQDRLPPELLRFVSCFGCCYMYTHPALLCIPHSLTRTNNVHTKRNREGTLLILYDQNDGAPAEAAAMATELVLRGWENVYVLSGGASSKESQKVQESDHQDQN